jgi:hypothetical protein
LGELDALEVQLSVDANQDNCTSFCQATQPTKAAECESTCLNGSRKILATHTYTHADLLALDQASAAGSANLALSLSLSTLGPTQSSLHGPDLVVDRDALAGSLQLSTESFSATDCAVVEGCLNGPGTHRLLRFDGTIQNLGDQDFILGSPENNPLFKYSACHNHYHLQDIMLYELLTVDQLKPVTVGGQNIVGRKQGFCMEDGEQVVGSNSGKYDCNNQGITAGWADVYDASLDCQWLDVTGVPQGKYVLRVTVNPSGRYSESDRSNDVAEVPVTIPAE